MLSNSQITTNAIRFSKKDDIVGMNDDEKSNEWKYFNNFWYWSCLLLCLGWLHEIPFYFRWLWSKHEQLKVYKFFHGKWTKLAIRTTDNGQWNAINNNSIQFHVSQMTIIKIGKTPYQALSTKKPKWTKRKEDDKK